jgi:thiosulfate/3-mercaptopyruvate sulfurtransferase
MLPSKNVFQEHLRRFGVESTQDPIVLYDSTFFSSFRVWWMFLGFGFDQVHVLNGGLPAWLEAGFELEKGEAGEPTRQKSEIEIGEFKADWVYDLAQIDEGIAGESLKVLDARPAARFLGQADEPRATIYKGKIPGSVNIVRDAMVNEQGTFRSNEELKKVFAPLLEDQKQLVTSCGSGVSACLINFALTELGEKPVPLYDGSFAEYGNRQESKVE